MVCDKFFIQRVKYLSVGNLVLANDSKLMISNMQGVHSRGWHQVMHHLYNLCIHQQIDSAMPKETDSENQLRLNNNLLIL